MPLPKSTPFAIGLLSLPGNFLPCVKSVWSFSVVVFKEVKKMPSSLKTLKHRMSYFSQAYNFLEMVWNSMMDERPPGNQEEGH